MLRIWYGNRLPVIGGKNNCRAAYLQKPMACSPCRLWAFLCLNFHLLRGGWRDWITGNNIADGIADGYVWQDEFAAVSVTVVFHIGAADNAQRDKEILAGARFRRAWKR